MMSSSRLTTLQVHERFKQNYNALYSRQMIPKEELFDDSLTNLQWLQNLNVNFGNPVPSIPAGGAGDAAARVSVACRRIRGGGSLGVNRIKPRAGDVAQTSNIDSPAKCNPGSQRAERPNVNRLQSKLLNGKHKNNGKKNPLPPLIPQSRTPLPNQYRPRVGGPTRDSQKDSLPRLSGSNDSLKLNTRLCENAIILNASPEMALLSDATSNQYVLSPRQMDRDLLPGQVDYKNNPYVKPPFKHLALICMALRRSRNDNMTIQKICDWIKNNFIYYRCVGPDWQNSIRDHLARHKCFERVGRSAGKAAYWRISPKYEDIFSEDLLRKRRLASAGEEKSQSSSSSDKCSSRDCSPSIEQVCDYDFLRPEDFAEAEDEFFDGEKFPEGNKTSSASSSNKGSAGHKRKQITPQRRSSSKKSKHHQPSKVNPLLDQAPELGSLKGEFTFTNILEEMRLDGSHGGSSVNSSLSLPSTPNLAPRKKHTSAIENAPVISMAVTIVPGSDGLLTDVMLPIDPSLLLTSSGGGGHIPNLTNIRTPSPLGLDAESRDLIEEFLNTDKLTRCFHESLGKRRNCTALNTPTLELDRNEDVELSKSVEALNLTVTGNKIERPAGWIPHATLDLVLGERKDHFNLDDIDLDVGAYDINELFDVNDENSPRGIKKKGRRRPGSASSGNCSMTTSPRRHQGNHLALTPQQQKSPRMPWHETKAATDTIQSLLGFD